jgi:hypothetical protein
MEQSRQNLMKFALEAYRSLPHPRTYALTDDARTVLAIFAQALFQRRAAEDRTNTSNPTASEEMAQLIQTLSDAGVNLLQKRPNEPEPPPKPWIDPVSGQQLPNPFNKKNPDLRGQSLLMRRDPKLGEHYKKMAEDPFGTLAALQDAEVEARSLAAITYDENTHKLNPFLGENLSRKAEFMKRDPELAKFFEQESKPVSIPVFGRNKNLTIQGRLYKDPHAAATYKIAEQVAQQWLASDKQAAEKQRKTAEAALAKLQSQIA